MVIRLSLCVIFLVTSVFAQNKNIESRQKELNSLRNEIQKLENEIQRKSQREKKTYALLDQYNRKTHLISKLINTLKAEEEQKSLFIENNEALLRALESQSGSLKTVYGNFVQDMFRQMNRSQWSMAVDSSYVIKSYLQHKVLRSLSPKSKAEVKRLDSVKIRTLAIQAELVKTRIEKENILKAKVGEEKYLSAQLKEKQNLLNQIKKDKNSITQEIESKKQAEQKIHSLIERLVTQARKRAEEAIAAENRRKRAAEKRVAENKPALPVETAKNETNIPLAPSANFKGRLLSPIKSGSIIRRYGQSTNAKLKTVTMNYGIDIKSAGDNSVRSAGDGEVSAIDWIPGYGTVIIISHGSDLRTVYGRVTEVAVHEGQKVSSGSNIGRISESLEGDILHFEVWNERKSQNPESWIGRF